MEKFIQKLIEQEIHLSGDAAEDLTGKAETLLEEK
jgi:hypothetical protein